MIDIADARAIIDAATAGPWRAANGKGSGTVQARDCAIYINVDGNGTHHPDTIKRWQADATFIAAARQGWPAALAECERLRRLLRDATCPFDSTAESRAEIRKEGGIK